MSFIDFLKDVHNALHQGETVEDREGWAARGNAVSLISGSVAAVVVGLKAAGVDVNLDGEDATNIALIVSGISGVLSGLLHTAANSKAGMKK